MNRHHLGQVSQAANRGIIHQADRRAEAHRVRAEARPAVVAGAAERRMAAVVLRAAVEAEVPTAVAAVVAAVAAAVATAVAVVEAAEAAATSDWIHPQPRFTRNPIEVAKRSACAERFAFA